MVYKITESFGVTKYEGWTENGFQVYGCRGIGEKYKNFYSEDWSMLRNHVTWEQDDWPWHYFALDETGEKLLQMIMKKYDAHDFYTTEERE